MSSTQPGSPTPLPSASLEERIRERVDRRGSEMERRRGSGENTGLFSFFLTPSSFTAWLPSCYNVKLAFLSVYREQCGTVAWSKRGEGNDFGGGCLKEGGERWRRRTAEQSRGQER